jgi:outer membrane murein-binding lipoprotein Lpp
MKTPLRLPSLLLVSAALLGGAAAPVSLSAQSVAGAVADAQSAAIKSQLQELDAQIDQLDELHDHAPTAEEKAAAKARIAVLKERRSDLRKEFVQTKYELLKAEVKEEFVKLSAWSKRTFSSRPDTNPEARAERVAEDATKPANMKASLALLDAEIKRVEQHCEQLPRGPQRETAELRVKALKQRRSELAADFRQARFDALMADVKAEAQRMNH